MLDMDEKTVKMEDLGYDNFFESNRAKLELDNFAVARVISETKGAYKIKNTNGEYLAKITGKMRFNAKSKEDYPAVGDWVAITELDNDQAVIQAIFPRKSIIKRKFGDKNKIGEKSDIQIIAANIDVAFIVESVGRDYSLNRLERYLAIAKDGGIEPAVILNKIDLISQEELELKLAEIKERLGDVEIIPTSAANDEGLDKLKNYIKKGKTYCFLGSSGVGKSSIINKLLEKDSIKTGDISEYSDRGRHITTKREMYFLASGGIVIDNPGVREVGMTDTREGIDSLFGEIIVLANECKFIDCTHTHEPGCAVLAAVKSGALDVEKYENYISLKKEAEHHEASKMEKRQKGKQFGKFVKKMKKELKGVGFKDF